MGFFPTDAIDGDEIGPNTNGSYFKYVAADDKWILISNADVYSEAEVDALIAAHEANPGDINHLTDAQVAALHSDVIVSVVNVEDIITAELVGGESIDNAIDALIATHAATPHGQEYGYEKVSLMPENSCDVSSGTYFQFTSITDWVITDFYIGPQVDPDTDIDFTFFVESPNADAAMSQRKYIGAIKTDGSEAIAHNIHNGTAFNVDVTNANQLYQHTLTVAHAGFAAGDKLHVLWRGGEAGRIPKLYPICVVKYKYA